MGGEGDSPVTVHLRFSNGPKVTVQAALDATVGDFKRAIAEKCDVPAEQQRLIYKGRILKDGDTLKSYGLEADHTVHVVRGATPPVVPADTTATTTMNGRASLSPNSSMGGARDDGANESGGFGVAGLGGLLFPGLGVNDSGASGTSGVFGFPELDQLHSQLIQNPSMLSEIVNMPAVQSLINNPEIMQSLITNNPQLREIIDRNPDIAHVLNDPNMLRQTLEVARNPELMREMMRNTDRAMSNIESSPEGFNMLRRMYETIQEPFLNAATTTGNSINSNPFSSLFMNQGTNQSRDQMPNSETATRSSAPNANPLPNPWSSSPGDAQTTNSRSSPAAGRTSTIAGLGGLGLPELGRVSGGLPNLSLLNQVMQNPVMAQMTQNLLSDPHFMNQIFSFNLNSRNAAEPSSQLREMLSNPELIRQMASPEIQQQFQSIQQSLLNQIGRQQLNQEQHQAGGNSGVSDVNGLELFTNLFGGLGGAGSFNASNVRPEELYAAQLSQLQEMGFLDTQQNIRSLIASGGNVAAAIERLLSELGH